MKKLQQHNLIQTLKNLRQRTLKKPRPRPLKCLRPHTQEVPRQQILKTPWRKPEIMEEEFRKTGDDLFPPILPGSPNQAS